jgi:hypothetical protein
MNVEQQKIHDALARRLTDEGKLVELGWQTMRLYVIPPNASATQVTEMRKAFFMGAQHVYASMMAMFDSGDEPTDDDMRRMTHIHNELEAFRMEVTSVHKPGRG